MSEEQLSPVLQARFVTSMVGFDSGVHQELEAAVAFLHTFVATDKSMSEASEACAETGFKMLK